ncbi:hypothetical protein [Nocardioides conyzicola]|uniref:Uncharacterized protein n=1 Tax=Nocardioides conyzicola TaxID=1651781 RepID=A0ABP8X6X3_9ACTN
MIDTTYVAFAYAVLTIAALASAVAVAAIVVAVRDLRGTGTPVVLSVAGPSDRTFSRAA